MTRRILFSIAIRHIRIPRDREARYAHELTDDDHRELIDRLVRIQGMALLSSYPNEIYAVLRDHGWQCIEWQTACHAHRSHARDWRAR
ncbi:MAG: hypothetical protein KatS3mg038_2615 [Candidatus Kapaibacterium sp.]|nr:MAG: hypothetical protein KatS3mg038_2615 [Candidatus Kapabacteria bacterium]